jgi:hypothetical protein
MLHRPNRDIFLGLPDLDLVISPGLVFQETGQAFVDVPYIDIIGLNSHLEIIPSLHGQGLCGFRLEASFPEIG